MTSDVFEPGVRPRAEPANRGAVDWEASRRMPHFGAYGDFPDSPCAYRDQTETDKTLEKLFRAATFHAQSRIYWYDAKAVMSAAGKALGVTNFDAHSLRVRKAVGPPWNNDHKLAMAAAVVAGSSGSAKRLRQS